MNSQTQINGETKREINQSVTRSPEPQTLAELFYRALEKHPRANALNYKKDDCWHPISTAEMIARAENIALGLYALGVRRGDRIALLAANSPEWTLTDAGCQLAGAIDVPVYTTLAASAVEYILKDSGAKIFFLQNREIYENLREVLGNCETLEKLIFFDLDGIEKENALSLQDLQEKGERLKTENSSFVAELKNAVQPDDIATLIYTSGTTGEPKGVMLSHRNFISNIIDSGVDYTFSSADVPLSVLPLSHVFERTGMYVNIFNGMAVHYAESIEKAPDNLREVCPTIFVGVPRIFEKVYARAKQQAASQSRLKEMIFDWAIGVGKEYAEVFEREKRVPRMLAVQREIADRLVFSKMRDFFGGRLRFCITGGAALSEDIAYIFTGAGIGIMQGYGLTETSPVVSTNTPLAARTGTVGKPIRNVRARIAEDGEIEVSGPNLMRGYYNKPDATREAFTRDGWFKTGDIGEIDADGFLKITDRKKELFKTSGGKYIAPAPIEQKIKASRFVNQVVLVGNERKFPAALIVPNFEALRHYAKLKNLSFKSPEEFCQSPQIVNLLERQIAELTADLSKFEKVKKIALLENEMTIESGELTPTLKIKRRVVEEKYKDLIEKIYFD